MPSSHTKQYIIQLLLILQFCLPCSAAAESFTHVQFVKNHDGDSITFNIPDTPAIVGKNAVIRLRGVDTPEIDRKNCTEEEEIAENAKQLVYKLLTNARTINLHNIGRGKYFRILADVEFDGQDLASVLLDKGFAVTYSGGRKSHNWCSKAEGNSTSTSKSNFRSVLPPKISGVYVWPPPPIQNKKNDKKQ